MNKYDNALFINRFINFIIDTLVILLIFFLFLRWAPLLLTIIPFDFELDINIVLLFIFFLYYMIFESITGRTIGKFLTKTKVVSQNCKKVSLIQVLLRTIVRLFFIEIISFLSKRPLGWHDNVSRTMVVKIN